MGVSYYAHAFIGVEIDPSKLEETVKERGCNHPLSSAPYCGHCGKPTWVTHKQYVAGCDCERIGSLRLVCTYERERVFACVDQAQARDYRENATMLPPPDVDAIRQTLRRELESRGLWDEKRFGLWSVMNVSC